MFIYTQVLAEACATEVIVKTILPFVMTMASDQVAIVRFNVAKTLVKLFRRIDDTSVIAMFACTYGRFGKFTSYTRITKLIYFVT